MSQQLINRSPDLKGLQDEGYPVKIKHGFLLVINIPYVNSKREIMYGTLVSNLTLAGDITDTPDTHVAHFIGEFPCDKNGVEISKIRAGSGQQTLAEGLVIHHSFSSKPPGGYKNYYEKMKTYIAIISGPAEAINPDVSAKMSVIEPDEEDESVFHYIDNASSRAGINPVNKKLELGKVAIIAAGGTGSYVLDFVAKTPVKEIHVFDGDRFSQHNAFRSPGAPSIDELRAKPQKVIYFKDQYSKMRRNIFAHDYYIDASNIEELRGMDFVFLCLDRGKDKKLIVEKLEEFGIPFVDVGMGVYLVDDALGGILRVTASTDRKREHVNDRIPFAGDGGNDEYAQNIQISELNALNAALAVIKWKKLFGFYKDFEDEHHSTYTIDGNALVNEEQP